MSAKGSEAVCPKCSTVGVTVRWHGAGGKHCYTLEHWNAVTRFFGTRIIQCGEHLVWTCGCSYEWLTHTDDHEGSEG